MNRISLSELILCLSEALDLISNQVTAHHKQTAATAYHLAQALKLEDEYKRDIVMAASLHDIGGLSLKDRLSALYGFEDSSSHAEKGYRLLSSFEPFKRTADIIRYHHTKWNHGTSIDINGDPLSLGSQIVMMADRITVMLKPDIHILNQAGDIIDKIKIHESGVFNPDLVNILQEASAKDSFWMDIKTLPLDDIFHRLNMQNIYYTNSDIDGIMILLSNIIDFRSLFTATHSKGVAITAQMLAEYMGFTKEDCRIMRISGLLHDIGKLAVPTEILEKNGALDVSERNIIQTHAYYTNRILSHLSGFETVREWASLHHESINGRGYPFGLRDNELSMGARIMKAADVFVALMEERPYRKSMSIEKTMGILNKMADNLEIDPAVVSILADNAAVISKRLLKEQREANIAYKAFLENIEN